MNDKKVNIRIVATSKHKFSRKETSNVSMGDFVFSTNDMEIPFGFDAGSYEFTNLSDDKLRVDFTSGNGILYNDFDINKDYDDVYAKLGLKREDITAKFLSEVVNIKELNYEFTDHNENNHILVINHISFIDESNNAYRVSEDVICKFNKTQNE